MDIPELKELNLDDHEVKVYVACLRLGSAKANDIANESGLLRPTTYGVLRSLIQKGLVSTVTKDGIRHFQAATPKQLMELLNEKKEKIASIIPKLEELRRFVPATYNIELFEGQNGVKTILNDLVAIPNRDVKLIGVGKKWMEFSSSFLATYYRKKKENNVHVKAINPDTPEDREAARDKKIANTEIRYSKGLAASGSVCIYGDKISFVDYEEGNFRGFIVKDKHLVEIHTHLFDTLWKTAKP